MSTTHTPDQDDHWLHINTSPRFTSPDDQPVAMANIEDGRHVIVIMSARYGMFMLDSNHKQFNAIADRVKDETLTEGDLTTLLHPEIDTAALLDAILGPGVAVYDPQGETFVINYLGEQRSLRREIYAALCNHIASQPDVVLARRMIYLMLHAEDMGLYELHPGPGSQKLQALDTFAREFVGYDDQLATMFASPTLCKTAVHTPSRVDVRDCLHTRNIDNGACTIGRDGGIITNVSSPTLAYDKEGTFQQCYPEGREDIAPDNPTRIFAYGVAPAIELQIVQDTPTHVSRVDAFPMEITELRA